MSYGKDPNQLINIPRYGGSTTQMAGNATRTRKGRRGSKAYWLDTYKPNEMYPDIIRILAGNFSSARLDSNQELYYETTPWKEVIEHFHGGVERGAICSAGPYAMDRNRREKCHGCDIYWNSYEQRKANGTLKTQRGPISISSKFVFNIIDKGLYHLVPQTDLKTGQYRMDPSTNQPYMAWVKCRGVGCIHCQNSAGIQTRNGHIQPWMLSRESFNTLNDYTKNRIINSCLSCGGQDTISTMMWQCGNSACGELIFDMQNTTYALEQIKEIVEQPYLCRTCNVTAYPEEVISCSGCNQIGRVPKRASIFDVDLQLKATRFGDGTWKLMILDRSVAKPVEPQYQDLLQQVPDLDKVFAPSSLEYQAKIWNISQSPRPVQMQLPFQQSAVPTQSAQPVQPGYPQPMYPVGQYPTR